jgi:pSer/pThr/pTyr-binding forkhead associated (FHA) protein
MKLSLVVLTPGKQEGKVLPINLSQFVVGRDPQCQLRPASPLISKRHCAILQREGKVFLRDFDSTNGTVLNDQPIKGEVELHHDDRVKIGPLLFGVRLEAGAPVDRRTPPPPTKAVDKTQTGAGTATVSAKTAAAANKAPAKPAEDKSAASSDDDIANMLLSLHDDTDSNSPLATGEVPDGSTVLDLVVPPEGSTDAAKTDKEKDKTKTGGNTSSAAKSILEKYMRRPRG